MEKAESSFTKGAKFIRKFGFTPLGIAMLFVLAVFPLVLQDEVITRLLTFCAYAGRTCYGF